MIKNRIVKLDSYGVRHHKKILQKVSKWFNQVIPAQTTYDHTLINTNIVNDWKTDN